MAYIAPGATVSTPADGSVTTAKLATGLNVNLASGSVSAPSATFLGSTTTGLFSPATDNFGITTAGVERLRILSTGSVGIGTSSPQAQLQVLDRIKISDSTQAQGSLQLGDGASTSFNVGVARWNGSTNAAGAGGLGYFSQGTANSGGHYFYTGDAAAGSQTPRMVILPGGNVGIGTSSPSVKLEVSGSTSSNPEIRVVDGTVNSQWYASNTGELIFGTFSNHPVTFRSNGSPRLSISSAGNVGIGTTSPTSKLDLVDTAADPVLSIRAGSTFSPILYFEATGVNAGAIKYDRASQALTFSNNSSSTERLRIDSSGRLLVGTSSSYGAFPAILQTQNNNGFAALFGKYSNSSPGPDVEFFKGRGGSASVRGIVQNGDQLGIIAFSGDDGTNGSVPGASIQAAVDGTPGANDMPGRLVFSTTADGASSPTERMRIDAIGRTQLYSAGGNHVLRVASDQAAGTSIILIRGLYSATDNTTTGSESFRVFTNGNVVNSNNSYGSISDIKLKENIVDATSQWSDIKALQVRNYNFKEGQTHTQIGLIAQEAELVSPGLVSESPDRDEDGNDLGTVTKSVNYSVLYMKAVKALQEAMERIETLEAKVATLEAA